MYYNVTMRYFCVAIVAPEKQQCLLRNVDFQVLNYYFFPKSHGLSQCKHNHVSILGNKSDYS